MKKPDSKKLIHWNWNKNEITFPKRVYSNFAYFSLQVGLQANFSMEEILSPFEVRLLINCGKAFLSDEFQHDGLLTVGWCQLVYWNSLESSIWPFFIYHLLIRIFTSFRNSKSATTTDVFVMVSGQPNFSLESLQDEILSFLLCKLAFELC